MRGLPRGTWTAAGSRSGAAGRAAPLTTRRREPCPAAPPAAPRELGGHCPTAPPCGSGPQRAAATLLARQRTVRPSHLPRPRRPGAPQPTVPARGAAGWPCSASAPSLPHHHPPPSSRRRGGSHRPRRRRRRQRLRLLREAAGTLKLLAAAPAGAMGRRPRLGSTERVSRGGCVAGAAAGRSPPAGAQPPLSSTSARVRTPAAPRSPPSPPGNGALGRSPRAVLPL